MKLYKPLFFALLVLFTSCTDGDIKRYKNVLLDVSKLESATYTINISENNTIVSAKGAIINIPAGAIKSESEKIDITISEAYDINDMVKANLATQANGIPLSSGGMINIKADVTAEIVMPLSAYVPTKYNQKGMQVYKGEGNEEGLIDWTSPEPLADTPTYALERGKQLFQNNCSSCHNPTKDATGPELAYVSITRDKEWMYAFTRHSARLIASGDSRANYIFNAWGKTAMTAFPNLTDEQLDDLYGYLQNIAYENNLQNKEMDCYDSCMASGDLLDVLYEKSKLIGEQGLSALVNYYEREEPLGAWEPVVKDTIYTDTLVAIERGKVGYYEFNVDAFGWYNIDMVADDLPGAEESLLTVMIKDDMDMQLHIYLVIPSNKIFNEGGHVNGRNKVYGFYKSDGRLPLVHGRQAYILAMGEKDGDIVFGKTSFITEAEQVFDIKLEPIEKETFNKIINSMNFDGVELTVEDSKNADSLREFNEELEQLRSLNPYFPVNCNCNPYSY